MRVNIIPEIRGEGKWPAEEKPGRDFSPEHSAVPAPAQSVEFATAN
jgi:hypothetical protein